MSTTTANGITLEYDTLGPASGEPLLVVQGLGDQLTKWDDGFPQALAARGFRVIRFDNRDVGLSTHLDDALVPDLDALVATENGGAVPAVPYTLDDMADDAVAVLDAACAGRAHLLGVSMGGMIAQLVAARHPHRVLSLTSVMSTTGNPELPQARPEALAALTAPGLDPREDEEGWIAHSVAAARVLSGPRYPCDEERLRAALLSTVRRNHDPAGFVRQLAAVATAPDRRTLLQSVSVPALVVHGTDDPLLPFAAGQDIAAALPHAELLAIPGMGHHLPPVLYDRLANALAALAGRARGDRSAGGDAAPA